MEKGKLLSALQWTAISNSTVSGKELHAKASNINMAMLPLQIKNLFTISKFNFHGTNRITHFSPLLFKECSSNGLNSILNVQSNAAVNLIKFRNKNGGLSINGKIKIIKDCHIELGETDKLTFASGALFISYSNFSSTSSEPIIQINGNMAAKIINSHFENVINGAIEAKDSNIAIISCTFRNVKGGSHAAIEAVNSTAIIMESLFEDSKSQETPTIKSNHHKLVIKNTKFTFPEDAKGTSILSEKAPNIDGCNFPGEKLDALVGEKRVALEDDATTSLPDPTIPIEVIYLKEYKVSNWMIAGVVIAAVIIVIDAIVVIVLCLKQTKGEIYANSTGPKAKPGDGGTVVVKSIYSIQKSQSAVTQD